MTRTFALVVGLCMVVAAACGTSPEGDSDDGAGRGDDGGQPPPAVSATASLQTAADLFRSVASEAEANYALGPQTVRTVLAMIHAGAGGTTAEEIAKVLHLEPGVDLAQQIGDTASELDDRNGDGVELRLAEGAWIERQFDVKASYREIVEEGYGAEVAPANFRGAPAQAEEEINAWVSDHTEGKIERLLRDQVDNLTRLVLVSATYLKALWADEFDTADTRPEPFTLGDGTQVEVPTMHRTGEYSLAQGEGWRSIALPYRGEDLVMTVIVPDDIDGFVSTIDGATLEQAMNVGEPERVQLALPRFELRFRAGLTPALTDLGMATAFDPDSADLSGIADEDLYVSFIQHEAWVKVDEEGTEAAAATGGGVGAVSAPATTPFPVDRPFVFVVHDRPTGEALFMGRVLDPRRDD